MNPKRPRFRLDVLGQIRSESTHQLTILAEFGTSRVLEHIHLPDNLLNDFVREVSDLRGFIESNFPPDYSEMNLQAHGTKKFELLFPDKVGQLFNRASGSGEQLLPLVLCVEDYRIGSWPWEYIFDDSRKQFVCQEYYPISRGIFTLDSRERRLQPRSKKIRILVVVGVPPRDPEASPKEQVKWISEVLKTNLDQTEFELEIARPKGPGDLRRILRDRYESGLDILHFFGHAAYDAAKDKGFVVFKHDKDEPQRYYADEFARLLADSKVQLVFLNACETGRSSESSEGSQTSVAAALLGRGIPAVIAAQFSMPDVSSHYLASMVYNALATGIPLIEALSDGREAMGYSKGSKFFDWGIPVLYSFDPDLVIFRQRDARALTGSGRGKPTGGMIRALAQSKAQGKPSVFVTLKSSPPRTRPKFTVAIVDIDTKVGFLPELIEKANRIQSYFQFKIAYLPFPTSTFGERNVGMTMFVPKVETYLSALPDDLNVSRVCCLTACKIDDGETTNLLSTTVGEEGNVAILSTFGLRGYAESAITSFPKAVLFLCLGALVVMDDRWDLDYHPEMNRCILDYCENLSDMVEGLKHMKFDHVACRGTIQDQSELAAIDGLLGLPV